MMMAALRDRHLPLYGLFCLILVLNIGLWLRTHDLRPAWGNVPPVTTERATTMMALGDQQFGYRMIGLMLQNLGSTGGKEQGFQTYNYGRLGEWFGLASRLDPESNFVPALAAYYYGATRKVADLTPIIDYLAAVGHQPQKQKWRWLAHAVYLARYDQGDLNKALMLANQLAALPRDDMPPWARQMPVFVMNAQGDKQAAYALMMGILSSGVKDMSPTEIRFIRDYVCDQILTPEQAAREELCLATK